MKVNVDDDRCEHDGHEEIMKMMPTRIMKIIKIMKIIT